ncbi:unnamed protein product [Rotaria sordida]|uniref:Uncharacterized protein n=1 Tax=Rotaria sordida TaxID=392033 RepID=A0A814U2J3_9BILA|nr:unnamed protein product [Rotaria sordida]CAF3775934.1 unnamed protein product [Rotaria sordida]
MALDTGEKTIIDYATEGSFEDVERVLKNHVPVDVHDEHGMTPLQHAAFKGHANICSLLLAHDADVNDHEHDQGYTALMFGALSGNSEVVRILLEAGAKTHQTNRIGRTAAQLAAFTGQKQCVDTINNYVTLEDLKYYTIPQGQETEGKLPESCVQGFQRLLITINFNPVHLLNIICKYSELYQPKSNLKRISNTLSLIIERSLDAFHTNEPNDTLAIKSHYIKTLIDVLLEKDTDDIEKTCNELHKKFVHGNENNNFRMYEEKFIRETIRNFPYKQCPLLQQLVRLIAPIPLGQNPSALSVLTTTLNGRAFEDEAPNRCDACGQLNATRRCTACKSISSIMENFVSNLANKLTGTTFQKNTDKKLSNSAEKLSNSAEKLSNSAEQLSNSAEQLSNSNDSNSFRKIQIPQAKIGLGSTEGDLISMIKRYLEIVGLVLIVWIFGYFQFSVSWILLIVFIYLFRKRQRAQFKERHKMLNEMNNNEEQYIRARLDELPSWVFFPDVERAEWLNRIIKQVWPYANKYLDKAVFHDVMIPMIRGTSVALSDFSFQKLDLGEIPPRIGGVKVYTDNVRDQVMMDIEVFYAGDAHVKVKVKGIVCGIKDIQFVGHLRIILSPLINTIPLVGAVTYFFLRNPSLDFKLTDAGTLIDIPALNDLMLVQINDILASMMVLPNRQVFPLVSDLQIGYLRWSNPQGVIRVIVIKAKDIVQADINLLGKGKSDPFVKVKAQGNVEYKTKTINNTTSPQWNEVFEFVIEQYESDAVEFEMYDEDPGKDDFLGRAQYPINTLVGKEAVNTWLTLQDVKRGSLNVSLQYFSLSTQKSALENIEKNNSQIMQQNKLSTALLVIFIDRCINLPSSKRTRREPNPFCRIKVDSIERKTQTFDSQTNPSFEHVSHILCSNPIQQQLIIEVCDARSNNEIIGIFQLPIKQIFDTDSMSIDSQTFPLKGVSEPLDNVSIVLHLSLHILSPGRPRSLSQLSATNTDQDITKDSLTRASPKRHSSDVQQQLVSSVLNPESKSITSSNSKTRLISDDPDLKSTPYGMIKLGISYAASRKSLSVTIHACKNLINVHRSNLPDPYVRVHLMPDFKKDVKKTKSIHDTINPVYDDVFEWSASLVEIRRQHLYIDVKNNSPLFANEKTRMGEIEIDLSNLDPENTSIAWYALQEPNTSAGGIMKIKYDAHDLTTHL